MMCCNHIIYIAGQLEVDKILSFTTTHTNVNGCVPIFQMHHMIYAI